MVNQIENEDVDLNFVKNWNIVNNEPINNVAKIITHHEICNKFCGLKNVGKTCAINSIIQVLIHIPPFKKDIMNFDIHFPFPEDLIYLAMKTDFQNMDQKNIQKF